MAEKRRKFSPQFKAEAVQLVVASGRPVAEVARELQINEGTLGNWVNTWRRDNPEPEPEMSPVERARLSELEAEVRRLRMENEFLKKAAADSIGGCNGGVEFISGGAVVEGLAGSGVEFARDGVEIVLGVSGQVGAFR